MVVACSRLEAFPDPELPLTLRSEPRIPVQGPPIDLIVEGTLAVCGPLTAEGFVTDRGFEIALDSTYCPPNAGAPIPFNYQCQITVGPLTPGHYVIDFGFRDDSVLMRQSSITVQAPSAVPLDAGASITLALAIAVLGAWWLRR